MTLTLIIHGPGGSYYLMPVKGGFKLTFDEQGRRMAAYGNIYPTEAEARRAACALATY